eukprot:c9994_g1_i1.p1 GENE.c9994_g1_i1~~c9994_g1_i1.p1  ORF type:complete len:545 (+),score=79.54 c9994_g1_i1:163-1635(+)
MSMTRFNTVYRLHRAHPDTSGSHWEPNLNAPSAPQYRANSPLPFSAPQPQHPNLCPPAPQYRSNSPQPQHNPQNNWGQPFPQMNQTPIPHSPQNHNPFAAQHQPTWAQNQTPPDTSRGRQPPESLQRSGTLQHIHHSPAPIRRNATSEDFGVQPDKPMILYHTPSKGWQPYDDRTTQYLLSQHANGIERVPFSLRHGDKKTKYILDFKESQQINLFNNKRRSIYVKPTDWANEKRPNTARKHQPKRWAYHDEHNVTIPFDDEVNSLINRAISNQDSRPFFGPNSIQIIATSLRFQDMRGQFEGALRELGGDTQQDTQPENRRDLVGGVVWEFKDPRGVWKPVPDSAHRILEHAAKYSETEVSITIGKVTCTAVHERYWMLVMPNGTTTLLARRARDGKRFPLPVSPSYWYCEDMFQVSDVTKRMGQRIQTLLNGSFLPPAKGVNAVKLSHQGLQVVKVELYEDRRRWESYHYKRNELQEKHKSKQLHRAS